MNDLFAKDYDLNSLEKIRTKRYGIDLFVTPRFKYHYGSTVYEETTGLLVRQNAKGVDTFIDVGAHYGFFDVLVGLSNPKCKILAFEPVPENCEVLQKNLSLNKVDASVLRFAISDRSGQAAFQISEASDNSGFIANPGPGVLKNIEVNVVKLDQFLDQISDGPILIKMDTDGNEINILNGMQGIIEKCKDVRMVVEFNSKCLKANGVSPQTLLDRLDQLGFDVFAIDDGNMRFVKYPPKAKWEDFLGKKARNLFCTKKGRSLNVLFFSHSGELSGSERSLLQLVSELIQDHGAICTVCLPGPGPLVERLQEFGAATIVGEYSWWCAFNALPSVEMIRSEYNRSFNWILRLRNEFEKIDPDVIFTNTLTIPWGAMTAALLGRPHLWRVSEFGSLDYGLEFYFPFLETKKFIINSSNAVVTNSEAIGRELFAALGPKNLETIHTNIEIPPEMVTSEVEKVFFDADAARLLILGTINGSKGQEDAVLAAIDLIKNRGRRIELLIAGIVLDPAYLAHLKQLATDARVEDHIHFASFEPNIFPLFTQSDIVLVCSKNEAFSRVIIEAMLMQKPVIATNTGGTPELIRDGETGLFYEPGNIDQLANQIQTLIDKPDYLRNIAKQGHDFARKKFTRENHSRRYFETMMAMKHAENPLNEQVLRIINELYVSAFLDKERILTTQIEEKEYVIQMFSAEVAEKERLLQDIYHSRAWSLIKFFRRIRSVFIPAGSRREKLWYSVFRYSRSDKT